MKRCLLFLITLFGLICLMFGSLAVAADDIGYIKTLQGKATILRETKNIPAALGDPIYMNDMIQTDSKGSLGITFLDNTRISIGPDTEFVIDDYVFKPKEKKLSFVSKVSRGTLHYISGKMSKLAKDAVVLKTPEGTVGIRGTHFLLKVAD